jgi:hypothetical protein
MDKQLVEPGIEVNGEAVGAVVDAFKQYPSVVQKYLLKHGLLSGKQGQIDRSAWYPLDSWLEAYQAIAKEVGLNSLYTIGRKIPENITLPPHINDIRSSLSSMDIGYHLNHRKNGSPMFDPATGQTLEGIGHYRSTLSADESRGTIVCENPYPCELDRGIVTGFATRFEPTARVTHDNTAPCRKKGANSCTYVVSW